VAKNITLIQAREMQDKGALLLDVRSSEEYQKEHLEGSISLPVERLAGQITALTGVAGRGRRLLLYCDAGRRSRIAAQLLQRLGYNNVYIVA